MNGEIKYAIVFEIKKSKKYKKIYYHPYDVIVGYEYDDGAFYGKKNKYQIFPQSFDNKFTVITEDIKSLILKSPDKSIDNILDNMLFEIYHNYYEVYYSNEQGKIGLKLIDNKDCIAECNEMFFDTIYEDETNERNLIEMYQELTNTIIGQDDVLKGVFANIVANKLLIEKGLPKDKIKKMKCNIFINGPTGTGKTLMVDEITKRLGIKYIKVDANDYTVAGYVGDDVNNIICDLYNKCNKNLEQAETGIIVIDEIDKLACPNNDAEVTTKAVQQALLTLMEGKEIVINRKTGENIVFDTSRLTIIVMGACEGIEKIAQDRVSPSSLGFGSTINSDEEHKKIEYETDDYVKYGFIPEFIGRFPIIYQTNDLEIEDFICIIRDSLNSPYLLQQEKFSLLGSNFNLSDEELYEIAAEAKKSKTGARGIKKAIEKKCDDLLFSAVVDDSEVSEENNTKQLTLTKNKNYQKR